MEANFLDFVVAPLWSKLAEVVPEVRPQTDTLAINTGRYKQIASGRTGEPAVHATVSECPSPVGSLSETGRSESVSVVGLETPDRLSPTNTNDES